MLGLWCVNKFFTLHYKIKKVTTIVYFTYSSRSYTAATDTKFGSGAYYFMDVVNCAKFYFNLFRDFDFEGGQNLALSMSTGQGVAVNSL